ncbi:hypothetical protein WHX56_01080 [Achromobacter veterisilvae]|uniref:Uncharacterized protein n=1 Tax=Achromobacter veterisilvae TaxID=2069367 RepID=A0ABZ2S5N2_9BURK
MLLPIAASDRPHIHATHPLRHAAYADLATPAQPARQMPPSCAAMPQLADIALAPQNPDVLRDQCADDRVHRAVQAFQASRRALPACVGAAWGSVECLQRFQPYFVVRSDPPIDTANTPAPVRPWRLAVADTERATLDRGFENSRQRRQLPA